jgi:hypothetical protein
MIQIKMRGQKDKETGVESYFWVVEVNEEKFKCITKDEVEFLSRELMLLKEQFGRGMIYL